MRTVVSDIETDGFLDVLSLMSVAWTYDVDTQEYKEWREWEVQEYLSYLNTFDVAVFHNGIGFDKPAIEKLTQGTLCAKMYDTLVVSRYRNPDLYGGHSLDAWGKRLGILKGSIGEEDEDIEEVYGVYTPELREYCKQDVVVTLALYEKFVEEGYKIVDCPFDWEVWKV
jgi:hypothetical protein